MKNIFGKIDLQRTLLVVVFSLVVTLMISPNLNLVPTRYEEGDIITKPFIIPDNVTLVDERSTELRRREALLDFPPIFDFDPRQIERISQELKAAFDQMHSDLEEVRRVNSENIEKTRSNSLGQIETLSNIEKTKERLAIIRKGKDQLINEIGRLTDITKPTPEQLAQLEKLRFDLLAVEAHLKSYEQSGIQLNKKLEQIVDEGGKFQEDLKNSKVNEDQVYLGMKTRFDEQLKITSDPADFRVLRAAQFDQDLENKIIYLLDPLLKQKVVSTPESILKNLNSIQIQVLDSTKLERFETLNTILAVEQVRKEIDKAGQEFKYPGDGTGVREAVISVAQSLVRPNLTENKGETERQKQELTKSLSPVYFNLKKGDVVAKAGDLATAQQVEFITALNDYNLKNPKYPQLIGTFIIVLITLLLVYQLIKKRSGGKRIGLSMLLLMGILILATLLFAQIILAFVPALTTLYDFLPSSTYNYLIPVALTSMLAGILMGFEIAIFMSFALSLFMAILLGNSLTFFIYSIMGSLVASIPLKNYETRYALWQQGLRISAINMPVLLVLTLLEQNRLEWNLAFHLGAGLMNGLGVAFLTSTILPLLEKAFDITTSMRLLELSNMNHPALKELAVRAPGTYHHSIVVGNLSESAAGGIEANSLLVRVASYYHDLGKMLCPLYFIENQNQKNYHDDLPAKTSSRIIINHVKDGLELAKKYRLGSAISEILAQHHGNSLVKFFFHKAGEEDKKIKDLPEEMEFRYPGPRPQTKEAGLVMVADVTEAATRSLSAPSPESIREMVQKLTTGIYMDGQLDESGMTFNDLNYIEKTFTKMLLSIHHHRITYPDLKVAPENEVIEGEPDKIDEQPENRNFLGRRRRASK